MKKVLLDTDIGSDVDDALALALALRSNEIELAGITTVYGDVNLRARIAKKMVVLSGKDVPVYTGEANPITEGDIWHTGNEGNGILTRREREGDLKEFGIGQNGVDFLIDKIINSSDEHTLCAIGPLTNIARALQANPRIEDRIKLYMMAGSTTEMQHNIACDLEAARIVFNSEIRKTIVPVEVTNRFIVERWHMSRLRRDPFVNALNAMFNDWLNYRSNKLGRNIKYTCGHDPLTMTAIIRPDLVKTRKEEVRINQEGIMEIGNGNTVDLVYDAYYKDLKRFFYSRLGSVVYLATPTSVLAS